jgi:hypothetical protein
MVQASNDINHKASWGVEEDDRPDRADAKRWFAGPDCRMCSDPGWVVRSKNLR